MSTLEKKAARFVGRVSDRGTPQPRISFRLALILFALAGVMPGRGYGQLELIPGKGGQGVFAGGARTIHVAFHNKGNQEFTNAIRTRLYLASSSTAVLISDKPWKSLEVPAGAIVLESAKLTFPAVRAETKFLIQWLGNTNRVIGVTQVQVYPTNLLAELKPLAQNQSLGVFDPSNQLKPLLKNAGVNFVDLGSSELEHFPGKLAILGPFTSQVQIPGGLAKRIKMLAKKGVAVVWILPPGISTKLEPSFYLVPEGSGIVVVAQATMVSDLAANPKSQLNLLFFCGLALHPRFLSLPDLPS